VGGGEEQGFSRDVASTTDPNPRVLVLDHHPRLDERAVPNGQFSGSDPHAGLDPSSPVDVDADRAQRIVT
jgi:hypothetical protein